MSADAPELRSCVRDEFIGCSCDEGARWAVCTTCSRLPSGLSMPRSSRVHAALDTGWVATRIAFDEEFAHALRVRGLTLTELASRARVTVATASSAVHGRPLNVSTATRLARALAAVPVVSELEAWARAPAGRLAQVEQPGPISLAASPPTLGPRSSRRAGGLVAADEIELPLDVA
jgi:hypothetical protein